MDPITWIFLAAVAVVVVGIATYVITTQAIAADRIARQNAATQALNSFEGSPGGVCFTDTCSVFIRYFTSANENQPVSLNLNSFANNAITTVAVLSNDPSDDLQIPVAPGGFTDGPGVYDLELTIDGFRVAGHRVLVFGGNVPVTRSATAQDDEVADIIGSGLTFEYLINTDDLSVNLGQAAGVKEAGSVTVCKDSRLIGLTFRPQQGQTNVLVTTVDGETRVVPLAAARVRFEIKNADNTQTLASGTVDDIDQVISFDQPIPVDNGLRILAVPALIDGQTGQAPVLGQPPNATNSRFTLSAGLLFDCDVSR